MEKSFLVLILAFGLVACSPAPAPLVKLDPPTPTARQMKLFQASCALCHAAENSSAPQVGDEAWDARFASGFDVLMKNTLSGTEGMPPLGSCAACSYEDFEVLIQFLAQQGKPK